MIVIPDQDNRDVKKYLGINPLTAPQIKALSTDRLVAYLKRYRSLSGRGRCDCCGEILTESDRVANAIAENYINQIKSELNTRPHSAKAHKRAVPPKRIKRFRYAFSK